MALETVVAANTSVRSTVGTAPQSSPATLGTRETDYERATVFRVYRAARSRRRNGEIAALFIGAQEQAQGRINIPKVSLEYVPSHSAERLYH
jgi:hypothetical protein